MKAHKIGYLIGSLARASLNRKLAKALVKLAPARALKQAIAEVDAVLIVTPEYNRSIPGALKNAIDWASRPHGTNAFTRKPSAVIGASPGKIGTAIAQQHLRGVLGYCNSPQMNAPEAYIQLGKGAIDDDGHVADESTKKFLGKFMADYKAFLDMVVPCVTSARS